MINANELRIGNYIVIKGEQKPLTVKDIALILIDHLVESMKDAYQPISLTPEILEKCGFIDTDGFMGNGGEFDVDVYSFGDFVFYYASIGKMKFAWREQEINCEYLHQLQNLYYAVIGEELTINL